MDKKSETIKKRYNRIAGFYDNIHAMMENSIMKNWRKEIWREAQGKILEVGVGTGNNIPFYPENAEVTAIDFSENMLQKAEVKAAPLYKIIDLRLMDAQNLEFPDATFDMVVTTCVFCSVPNPQKGLHEIRRVLKNDGRLIMLEHVRSKNRFLGLVMDLVNPLIVRISGANINRKTVENVKKVGLKVEIERDLMLDIVKMLSCSKN